MEIEGVAETERAVRFEVAAFRRRFVRRLWLVTEELNTLHPEDWEAEVAGRVQEFQDNFIAQVGDGYAGQDVPDPKWSYSGSLLYAITVITTIGERRRGEGGRRRDSEKPCVVIRTYIGKHPVAFASALVCAQRTSGTFIFTHKANAVTFKTLNTRPHGESFVP